MKIYKWEPSDQPDCCVFFILKKQTGNSYSGIAIELQYNGEWGKIYDEVLYDGEDFDEGESISDYKEWEDKHHFIRAIFDPPTWNI